MLRDSSGAAPYSILFSSHCDVADAVTKNSGMECFLFVFFSRIGVFLGVAGHTLTWELVF